MAEVNGKFSLWKIKNIFLLIHHYQEKYIIQHDMRGKYCSV